jgi:hypothetical protein
MLTMLHLRTQAGEGMRRSREEEFLRVVGSCLFGTGKNSSEYR